MSANDFIDSIRKRYAIEKTSTSPRSNLSAVDLVTTSSYHVVAELRPARRQPGTPDSLDGLLDSLAERGEVTRASLPKRRWTWKAKGLGLAAGSANALLGEIRSDR